MKRRDVILYGVAGAAAALGVGAALWRSKTALSSTEAGFWAMRFARPDGGELVLADFLGKPLLLNFWATWCPPCVTEMPLLDTFYRQRFPGGWRVLGLAVDSAAAVRDFLDRHPVDFAVGVAGMEGVELTRALGNRAGSLPFSVAFDRRGFIAQRKLGVLSGDDLEAWARAVT